MSGSAAPPGGSGNRPPLTGPQKIGIIAGAILVLLFLYWMGGGWGSGRQAAVDGSSAPAGMRRTPSLPPPEITPAAMTMPPPERPAREELRTPVRRAPPPRRPMPIMGWEEQGGSRADPSMQANAAGAGDDPDDALAASLRATNTAPARARRLRNAEFVIPQGTMIPCVRQQPINTQLPGFVSCRVSTDIFGADPNLPIALLDAGTILTGQIRQAMMHGTNRAFVLWTRARTPDNVVVELNSPGTDPLGQNGIAVDVNSNFWARFSGSIMLSFIDAGLQAAAIAASSAIQPGSGGQSLNLYSFRSGGRSAAARALDATVNIPPYGTAPQGEAEAVFVARDLDFSNVYRIRQTGR